MTSPVGVQAHKRAQTQAPRAHVLQRKCACGQHGSPSGECEERKKKREGTLQRAAAGPSATGVPAIVHEVLRSPGQPLDSAARAFLEPRFSHDFSAVRVHTDPEASDSARAVNALAYTVGHNVVFAAGQYSPRTRSGSKLLAHELTHVRQQAGPTSIPHAALKMGAQNDQAEREANDTARRVLTGGTAPPVAAEYMTLRKQDVVPVDLVPTSAEESERLKKLGINLPTVSEGTWRLIGGVADNAGKTLTEAEKQMIEAILKTANVPTGSPLVAPAGKRFLLHDTSAPVGARGIRKEQAKGRGPLGRGVSAWVPRKEAATIARPEFFEPRRPSTTEFEKAIEKFEQPADKTLAVKEKVKAWKERRDDLFRRVWNATSTSKRDEAFNTTIAGMSLTPDEIQAERAGNKKKRDDPDFNPGVEATLKAGSTENMTTSASWTVEEICKQVTPQTASSIAAPGKEQELTDACSALAMYFSERAARIASTIPVEIVQPGVKSGAKSEDTCDPDNPDIVLLSNPPYSDEQYKNLVLLYLRAAFVAGQFPEITTHFAIDAFVQGHCDPRCFDLDNLYRLIAAALGHGKGSTYGVKPSFGMKSGTNNVWWSNEICHGKHP